ncbi:AAA family ATPase [Terrimonas rubra]|uniref:AAA family ATPase n=1 Tax=Terrimonas rubra TaxID=1035890 RepID=A0ABW6AAH5_9BACT
MPQHTQLTTWHEVYRHIAVLLHQDYKGSLENPAQQLYDRLKETRFAKLNKGRLFRDRLSRISEWGLDPIQIFASFNYSKIESKRINIINSLLEALNSDKHVDPHTSFEGCPSPVITQIVQYRGWKVQNQIWEMFDAIMNQSIKGLQNKHFVALKEWRGLDIASLTMFLFWIDSDVFIPLDRNTVELLRTFDVISQRPRNYKEYYDLCNNKFQLSRGLDSNENVIRNFVRDAYLYSDKTVVVNNLSESTVAVISQKGRGGLTKFEVEEEVIRKQKERISGFQIVALRPGKPSKKADSQKEQQHLKNLTQGQLYQFYQAYQFDPQSDDIIIYNSDKEVDLYSQKDLKISISSIVGKNGSGKSTIAELLYLVINKIAFVKKIKSTEKLADEDVYADLFIKLDKLYKISVGNLVEIFEYKLDSDNKKYSISKEKINIKTFDIERFCYTIVVNYSLYALNTNIIGNWIYPLFHKNDSYQTPIVLNPLRNEGNINVNNEEGLAKSRMLSNILEPGLIDFEKKNVPELTPNSTPVKLILEFDKAKLERKRQSFNYKKLNSGQIRKVINALLGTIQNVPTELEKEAKEYIYLKVIDIAEKYSKFKKFKDLPSWLTSDANKLKEYTEALLKDTSHITFKLRQAINYLKYGIYKEGDNQILTIAREIREIKEISDVRTIELVPPSFFKINLAFDHGGTFNQLSSGEKQQIFSINTIAYHIYNIASVMYEEESNKYNNINIVFDEVELYFHPEMQRTYISNLLHRIKTIPLENEIHNINLLFITHSPFILSDIPSSNILRLTVDKKTRKSVPANNNEQTFGANIHDLLANDFFLENGFMGKFANDKIQEIIRQLEVWTKPDSNKEKLKDELYKTIQLIGEPLVKESLMELYREKIGLHESEISIEDIDKEIIRLQNLKLKR